MRKSADQQNLNVMIFASAGKDHKHVGDTEITWVSRDPPAGHAAQGETFFSLSGVAHWWATAKYLIHAEEGPKGQSMHKV